MSTTQSAGSKARTDGEESISDNSSGCYACGADAVGVRATLGGSVPVCPEHADAEVRA